MKRPMLGITLLIMLVIFSKTCLFSDGLNPDNQKETTVAFTGIVDSRIEKTSRKTVFTMKSIEGSKPQKWQVTASNYQQDACIKKLKPGDVITGEGKLKAAGGKRNPGGFNYYLYLKSKHIENCLYLPSGTSIKKTGQWQSLYYRILREREKLIHTCNAVFAPRAAHLITGICFGELQGDTSVRKQFSDAGVAHVLAVSGLHTGYLCLLILGLCRMMQLNETHQFSVLALALMGYIMITGFALSVIRAAIMLLAAESGRVFKRHVDTLSALSLSAAIILLIWPYALFTASFQMSFGAVLALVIFLEPVSYRIQHCFPIMQDKLSSAYGAAALVISGTALVGTWPATLFHFHQVSLIGMIGNLLIVPIVGLLLIFSWIALPILILAPSLKVIVGVFPALLAGIILDFTKWINQFQFMNVHSGSLLGTIFPVCLLILLAALMAAGYIDMTQKSGQLAALFLAAVFTVWMITPGFLPHHLKITYLDVGQGDAALIETPEGHYYMIDGGGYEEQIPGNGKAEHESEISQSVLLPALYSKGIDHLDGVFISHNHADHAQGIEELLTEIPVQHIFVSTKYNGPLLQQKVIPVTQLGDHDVVTTPDQVKFKVFWPDHWVEKLPDDEQNEHSLVMQVCYGKRRFLFTGDAGLATEQMLSDQNLRADVLKIGHHGSKTATSAQFLQSVHPTLAVISVGAYNRYGHPSYEVIRRLHQHHIPYLRTDRNGAVSVLTNGKNLKVRTYSR
ncbi:DNA internalization-related competence protein ComEC/Rec2 [Pseudoramibacter sp.]|uniref:DNA internalization-related competence protein ComEC/Rec2 n=1 Tax=Pseudoramibacter sp. TaxID=2034862 RepID=UPI0025FC646B|nr:DNA internalization-related competence protein ComEC/Rec2 [Pseudoramibacter sp.]MCH4072989.1 DNA internalization-related competence protein ComEC/Rec2 [Pseudoramibacter sp.]MCH4106760.1 DNA internalization-related competence protein ComEC/Rec2 [Pseudoramibacter sp.]